MTADVAAQASGATIGAVFDRAFRLYADRVAVTSEEGSWTYRELGRRADALAGLGLRPGDRAAVLSETRPEYVETYAALSRLGIAVVDLHSSLDLEAVSQTAAVRGRAAREGFERFVHRDDQASKPASGTP